MQWQRLNREDTAKIIDSVKSAAAPGLFAPTTSEAKKCRLPFYGDFVLYRLTNYASLPSFTFNYLGDGTFFHYLDGTEGPLYAVNDKAALVLNEGTILDYLSFFFTYTSMGTDLGAGEESGSVTLVRTPDDMPLLGSLDDSGYGAVVAAHRPPVVQQDDGTGLYRVETDIFSEGRIIRARVDVTAAGRVRIVDQKNVTAAPARDAAAI